MLNPSKLNLTFKVNNPVILGLFLTVLSINFCLANTYGIVDLINKRLSYMQDVARVKATQHLPVEVLEQEEKVLKNSLIQAEELGIEPTSIRPFIIAQMDAAKAIQYRYRAEWLSQPDNLPAKELNNIRTEIADLSKRTIQLIASELKSKGSISYRNRSKFISLLSQKHLHRTDKIRLFETIGKIRLKTAVEK